MHHVGLGLALASGWSKKKLTVQHATPQKIAVHAWQYAQVRASAYGTLSMQHVS